MMRLATALLLTVSTGCAAGRTQSLPPAPTADLCPAEGLCEAVGPEPLAEDLPEPIAIEGGTILPEPYDRAALERLAAGPGLQEENQTRLDIIRWLAEEELAEYRETCGTWCDVRVAEAQAESAAKWSTLEVALVAAGAVIVGGILGGVVVGVVQGGGAVVVK